MNYFSAIFLFLFPLILSAGTESDLVNPTHNKTILPSNQEIDNVKSNLKYQLTQTQENALKSLIETLNAKDIAIKTTFYTRFKIIETEVFNDFCEKADYFFQHLSSKMGSTSPLTIMLITKKHIDDFILVDKEEIAYLASLNSLQSFSSMYHRKGFPRQADVQKILDWPELKTESGKTNEDLLKYFSMMYYGKELPKHRNVIDILSWKEWKMDDRSFNKELFKSFSTMYYRKGLPKHKDVTDLISWISSKNSNVLLLTNIMSKLFCKNGHPNYEKLREQEETLLNLFFNKELHYKIEEKIMIKLKIITLFLITNKPQYHVQFSTIAQFYKESKFNSSEQIEQLKTLLLSYGGTIIESYIHLNSVDQEKLMSYAKNKIPLPIIKKHTLSLQPFIDKKQRGSLSFLKKDSTKDINQDCMDSTSLPDILDSAESFDNAIKELFSFDNLDQLLGDAFNIDGIF